MPRRPVETDPHRARAADVAARANVSESAVSRTFRGGSVSSHVRARVMAAARELGYRPNAMAQALLSRRSNVIAILMTTNTNAHFPEVLSELSHAADTHRLRVMLFTIDDPSLVSDAVDQILSYQVDAVLSLTDVPTPDAAALEANGVDLVLYNHVVAPYPATLVSCDHRSAGRILGEYLLKLGHRRFGLIEGPRFSNLAAERAGGVRDALATAGIPARDVAAATGDFSYESGRLALAGLSGARRAPSAIICVNDMMAIGAIDEATARGLDVPADLSVASFDGVAASRWRPYSLTTMRQPLRQLADAALEAVVRRRAQPGLARERRLLACELISGNSTRPC